MTWKVDWGEVVPTPTEPEGLMYMRVTFPTTLSALVVNERSDPNPLDPPEPRRYEEMDACIHPWSFFGEKRMAPA